MKKRWIVLVLSFAVLTAMLPLRAALAAVPVCEIGSMQFSALDQAIAAVPADTPTTIRLLQTISRTSTLTLDGSKKITLDLNGYNLDIDVSSGTALDIGYGASLITAGSGALNLTGILYGITAHDGGSADIAGSVTGAGDTGDHTNGKGIDANGSGVSVTVKGDVAGDMCGIDAYSGAQIHVTGSVTGYNYAVSANTGGQALVTGNASGSGVGIQADSATVEIGGDVTADGSGGSGVLASHVATVRVDGGVTATHQGVLASYQSELTVGGNVAITNDTNEGTAVIATASGKISVDGNATGGACGVGAETSGTITISGNISSYYCGINVSEGAKVTVGGNVSADAAVGVGVNAYSAGEATIDGTILAYKNMTFGESDGAQVTPTTKTDYLTYSDSAEPPSYVWLKDLAALPTVATNAVDSASVTQTRAYISGTVTTHGTTTETATGLVYGLNANPEIGGAGVTNLPFGSSVTLNNIFGGTINGLSPGTTYHVRAYAINSGVTVYGEDRAFATKIDITGLPDSGTVYVDGRLALTPSPSGGTWQWDKAYVTLTASGGSAEVKGVKAGTTTVTYTVGGSSKSVTIVIKASALPATGQDTSGIWILAGAAAAAATVAWVMKAKRKTER